MYQVPTETYQLFEVFHNRLKHFIQGTLLDESASVNSNQLDGYELGSILGTKVSQKKVEHSYRKNQRSAIT